MEVGDLIRLLKPTPGTSGFGLYFKDHMLPAGTIGEIFEVGPKAHRALFAIDANKVKVTALLFPDNENDDYEKVE